MSTKVLYQTLYQTEHLFRVPTETVADWGGVVPAISEPAVVPPVPAIPPVQDPQLVVLEKQAVAPTIVATPIIDDQRIAHEESPVELITTATVVDVEPAPTVPIVMPDDVQVPVTPPLTTSVTAAEPVQDTRPPAWPAEGRKPELLKHKVLILADEDLAPSDLLFLEKILKAVNLDVNGVDLLNVYGVADVNFAEVLRHKYIHHFITFGVPFKRINLDIMMDRYQPIRFDGITFLMADSLPVIEADQNLKRQLWNSLKRVFEIGNM
ncbi:hypothetical protein F5984_10325 [Rudanella paleaurantiibacter]|uniref:Uncharacterized protein n=1 Tax=Rudanella paleaurantiibacter TaxID=2614655 RepID=A0A7J5U0B3_9BACT|nr:hypothetical protein [Rudanella paleaurantiibacter]KAB7731192.1 hypothetical protein F5984_10325 [Rudanella paleaurantiibacter]